MTVIVGYVDDGEVWIAADSAGSRNDKVQTLAEPKCFQRTIPVTGESIIFGVAGSLRVGQILRYCLQLPPLGEQDVLEWAIQKMVPALENVIDSRLIDEVDFLFGVNGRLFFVEADLNVSAVTLPYTAIGCGERFALGALWALTDSEWDVRFRLEVAVEASAEFDAFVQLPVHIVSTGPTEVVFEGVGE